MPATTLTRARESLDTQIERTADEVVEVIKSLRKQRRAAMRAGDRRLAGRANRALLSYNDALADLIRGKTKRIDSADEVRALIDGFKAVTADLKAARREIREAKAFVDKAAKVVKGLGKVARKAITVA